MKLSETQVKVLLSLADRPAKAIGWGATRYRLAEGAGDPIANGTLLALRRRGYVAQYTDFESHSHVLRITPTGIEAVQEYL